MSKVFVFCIGGTGLRVMKSITMLLAGGMDAKGFTIVPVLIDPHVSLKERLNLQNLIEDYETIYNSINTDGDKRLSAIGGFFGTEMADLAKLYGQQNGFAQPVASQSSFGQYINYGMLKSDDVNKYLVQTIFSQSNLDNDLSVGFKGSPNVGTVVLGELIKGSVEFQAFCNVCQNGDRVFIISSIFGGTGASGFPMLEKTIRNFASNQNVQNAMIGAVSVLPYFSLDDPSITGSDIDSKNFLTKAKSALAYYEQNVSPDYLYYVGEQKFKKTYSNDENQQNDPAHFIELVAATALFDFLSKTAKPTNPQVLSRAIRDDKDPLSIISLGDSYSDVVKVVADMMLLSRLVYLLPNENQFPLSNNRKFDQSFYDDKEFRNLCNFITFFSEWYHELESNNRSFAPLNIAPNDKRNVKLVNWIQDFTLDAKDESYYLLEMIRTSNKDKDKSHDVKFRRFIDYAYKAINKYTSKILN